MLSNTSESFTGESLIEALNSGSLSRVDNSLIGMVKQSDKKSHIAFTLSGCEQWVDVPEGMVAKADLLGQKPCKDHTHALMQISLKEPTSDEGKLLWDLLAQLRSSHDNPAGCGSGNEVQMMRSMGLIGDPTPGTGKVVHCYTTCENGVMVCHCHTDKGWHYSYNCGSCGGGSGEFGGLRGPGMFGGFSR